MPSENSPLIPKYEEHSFRLNGAIVGLSDESMLKVSCEVLPGFLAVFLAAMDIGVNLTTYETIGSDFDQLFNANWIPVAYFLTFSSSLPVYHQLQSRYGWKKCLLFAVLTFAIGNISTGLSRSMKEVVFSRAITGLGAGYMFSIAPSILQTSIPVHFRRQYKVAFGVSLALGCALGPPFGGIMVTFISWRWTFLFESTAALVLACTGFRHCQNHTQKYTPITPNIKGSFFTFVPLLFFTTFIDPALHISPLWRIFFALCPALLYFGNPSTINASDAITMLCTSLLGAGGYHISLFQQTVFLKPAHIAGMWLTPAVLGAFLGGFFKGNILWASAVQFLGTIIALCHVGVVKKELGGLVSGWVLTNIGTAGVLSQISQVDKGIVGPCSFKLAEVRALGSFTGVMVGFTVSKWTISYHLSDNIPQRVQPGLQEKAYETAVIRVMACAVGAAAAIFCVLTTKKVFKQQHDED